MRTQYDEVGNPPYSSIWGHVFEAAFYLLLFAVIFLNKMDVLFLLFRFLLFLTIRGRPNSSMSIYNSCNMLFFALPTPFPPPHPFTNLCLHRWKENFTLSYDSFSNLISISYLPIPFIKTAIHFDFFLNPFFFFSKYQVKHHGKYFIFTLH